MKKIPVVNNIREKGKRDQVGNKDDKKEPYFSFVGPFVEKSDKNKRDKKPVGSEIKAYVVRKFVMKAHTWN